MWCKIFSRDSQGLINELYRKWADGGAREIASELDWKIVDNNVELLGWGTDGKATEWQWDGRTFLVAPDASQHDCKPDCDGWCGDNCKEKDQ